MVLHCNLPRAVREGLESAAPDNLEIDVTDPKLFTACSVSLPEMCRSQLTTDSAPGMVVTPLVALLFAIVAKLFA